MNKILITGGAGFIGQKTAALLAANGMKVRIMDTFNDQIHADPKEVESKLRKIYEVVNADICDLNAMESALDGVDGVVHLAAETGVGQSMYEIDSHIHTNLYGTAVLCKALRKYGKEIKSVVLASSRAVYGEGEYHCDQCNDTVSPDPRDERALDSGQWEPNCPKCAGVLSSLKTLESALRKPTSIYAISKASQEDLVQCTCDSLGIQSVALRYFNVYGEGQALSNPYTGILTSFVTRLKAGRSLMVYEDGLESRDFVHVDDVADANLAALIKTTNAKSINIGSGERLSIFQLAEKMSLMYSITETPEITGEFRVGDIRHCIADTRAAEKELDFSAKVTLDEGLKRFCDWASEQSSVDNTDQAYSELVEEGLLRKAN